MDHPPPDRSHSWFLVVGYFAYASALFLSAYLAFGAFGILPGLLVPLVWAYVLPNPRPQVALSRVVIVVVLGLILTALCLPAVQQAREASRRTLCRNNLKQIGLAFHNFHDVYDSFPPAYTVAADGRPLLSWRVLILPYLDQAALYKEFRLDEPWDSPHNRELLPRMPAVFARPQRAPNPEHRFSTSYVAIVGEGTPWPPGGHTTRLRDFKDGSSNTLLITELNADVPWSAPRDLEMAAALDEFTAPPADGDTRHHHRSVGRFTETYFSGRNVLLADGSVRFAGGGGNREFWQSLFTINDGAPVGDWDFPRDDHRFTRLRLEHVIPLIAFVILTLFPLPWVLRNSSSHSDNPPKGGSASHAVESRR